MTRDYEPCYDPDTPDDDTEHHCDADVECFSADWFYFTLLKRENSEDCEEEHVVYVAVQLLLE